MLVVYSPNDHLSEILNSCEGDAAVTATFSDDTATLVEVKGCLNLPKMLC